MYTVYDFVNSDIERKRMRFGWKAEIENSGLAGSYLVIRYRMLNFDESSPEYIGNDLWDMFLKSKSYGTMKTALDNAMRKYKRLYFFAFSIHEMKMMVSGTGLKIDVDSLIRSTILKKSRKINEKMKDANEN